MIREMPHVTAITKMRLTFQGFRKYLVPNSIYIIKFGLKTQRLQTSLIRGIQRETLKRVKASNEVWH